MVKKKIIFLCSPHVGTLDNWLPVIMELKNKCNKNLEFVCILTKTNWLNSSILESALIQISNKVFDKIVFKNKFGVWVSYDDFTAAELAIRNLNKNPLIWFSEKLKKNYLLKPIGIFLKKILNYAFKKQSSSKRINWSQIMEGVSCLLYDISQESKFQKAPFFMKMPNIPKFSIFHGLITKPTLDYSKKDGIKNCLNNGRVYLFSEEEIQYYKQKYGLSQDDIEVTGIPRHQENWINFLIKYQSISEIPFKKYVLIISRPSGSGILPVDRMKSSLELIKSEIINKLGYSIVIKSHPSESNESIYKEIFNKEDYNKNWIFSSVHPLVLGKNAKFAISFCSGVAVDLVSQGVPVIEILNLRGLPKFDNINSLRDSNGDPVLRYRFYNLLLGASDGDQFKEHLNKINSNYQLTKKELTDNYNNIYRNKANIADYIANDIATKVRLSLE